MAQEAGWISLGVVPTLDRGFGSKLSRDLDPALSRVGKSSGHRFGGIMGKAAVAGAAGIIGAGFAAFSLAKSSLAEAREAQEVGATTAAILKSTGGAAKVTKREYDALTRTLMHKTAIDDEQIATGGNLLLTFKNVKREGKGLKDIFGRALASSLDLTAAGFGSIDSTSKQLGKALNDPVKGMSALGRAGVQFSADQQDTIKALVETGDLLGAQKIILKEVESQVGGTAEAQKTSAKELEVAWGNLKEEIGNALLPVMEDLADFMLKKGIPAGKDFADWLKKDGIPQIKDFAKGARPLAEEILPAVGTSLGIVRDALSTAAPFAKDLVGAFNDMPDWAKKAIVGGTLGTIAASKLNLTGKGATASLLGKGNTPVNPLYVSVVGSTALGPDGTPIVTSTPDGKDPKTKKPKGPKKGIKGLGPFIATTLATVFGDDIIDEAKAELLYPWTSTGRKPTMDLGSHTPLADLPISQYEKSLQNATYGLTPEIQQTYEVLGLPEAENKLRILRERASRPIQVPVLIVDQEGNTHSSFGGHESPVPGESAPRRGRVPTINIEKMVAQDYRDMQRQLQGHSQQANMGGRP
jgi:hypothetical protein